MGHELELLLLLMHPHHLQLLAKQALELLLEGEGEGEPAHVGTIATLQTRFSFVSIYSPYLLVYCYSNYTPSVGTST